LEEYESILKILSMYYLCRKLILEEGRRDYVWKESQHMKQPAIYEAGTLSSKSSLVLEFESNL
jgi:hypothetical protein